MPLKDFGLLGCATPLDECKELMTVDVTLLTGLLQINTSGASPHGVQILIAIDCSLL